MKLCVIPFSLAAAFTWALAVFGVGLANLKWPPYGQDFLDVVSSVYPGYDGSASFPSVLVATGYAAVDGLVAGLILSLVYNCLARCCGSCKPKQSEA